LRAHARGMVRRPMHAPEGRRLLTATSIRHGVTIPSAEYYAYDGPIYVGHSAEPPDKVIADVQAVLQQQMGYYQGEVDGLLGPLTARRLPPTRPTRGSPRQRRSTNRHSILSGWEKKEGIS
jgi:hypothetical protein